MKRPTPKAKPAGPIQQAAGRMLDVAGAATFLGKDERWIRRRVSCGLLPYRKFSGRIIFIRHELETFLSDFPGVSVCEAKANLDLRSGGVRR